MLAGGPGLRASLTQEVQAGSRLCNKSHVSVFVYTSESQDLSGNEQHWCGVDDSQGNSTLNLCCDPKPVFRC